jgi:phage terminase large subunit
VAAEVVQPNVFKDFLARYAHDSVLFVREVWGVEPDPEQREALEEYDRRGRRISIRSGHGVGKTTLLAWMAIHHILTRFPQKTVATAPTSSQLFDALAAELFGWINKLPAKLKALLDVKSDRVELLAAPDESFISFRTSRAEQPEALAGVHSENVLLIGDEASGIPDPIFEAAAGSMSGHNATTILAGNPVRSSGLFYDTHHKLRDQWYTIRISCETSPRVSQDYVEDMKRRYGERSNAYRVRVLGEFPLADDDTVIPFELMEAALKRDVKPLAVRPVWGVDCARFGQDRSAIAKRKGNHLLEPVRAFHSLDTMELVGRIKAEWDMTPPSERPEDICVDVIGIGAGVVDRLRELKLPAVGINVSESPAMGDRFRNLRAELWWKGREWLAKRDSNMAGDEALGAELIAVKYKFTSNGKIQIEAKEDIKKRGLPSPDLADAFMLTFARDATAAAGVGPRRAWSEPISRPLKGLV